MTWWVWSLDVAPCRESLRFPGSPGLGRQSVYMVPYSIAPDAVQIGRESLLLLEVHPSVLTHLMCWSYSFLPAVTPGSASPAFQPFSIEFCPRRCLGELMAQREFHRGEKMCLGAENPCSSLHRDTRTQG